MDIETNGAERIFFVDLDYALIQKAKSYALDKMRKVGPMPGKTSRQLEHFAQDLMSRDIFNTRIKYCLVKLKELAVEHVEYYYYISRAIDLVIEGKPNVPVVTSAEFSIEEMIIKELSSCFEIWYRPDDVFYIDFAQDHQFISLNIRERKWSVSNVGKYFLQLPEFEAIAFILSLEIILTTDHRQSKFFSQYLLNQLISERNGNQQHYRLQIPYSLIVFDIVTSNDSGDEHYERYGRYLITHFGKSILTFVQKNLEYLRGLILFILGSEFTKFKYEAGLDLDVYLTTFNRSPALIDDQRKSIANGITLYRGGNYLDSLRVLYPVMEGTLDSALRKIGLDPSGLSGMRMKFEKLQNNAALPQKMLAGFDIVFVRNKILHGNIIEDDMDLVKPLFPLVLSYLKAIVEELDKLYIKPVTLDANHGK